MMRACPADFARLAGYLGFSCDDDSWVKVRNPLTLAHWTMPVVELLIDDDDLVLRRDRRHAVGQRRRRVERDNDDRSRRVGHHADLR